MERLPRLNARARKQFDQFFEVSLFPLILSNETLHEIETQSNQAANSCFEEYEKFLSEKSIEELLIEFNIPDSHRERFMCDPVRAGLRYMRPDGALIEGRFFVFETNLSSAAYGLPGGDRSSKFFFDLVHDLEINVSLTHFDVNGLFSESIRKKFPDRAELVLLNWIEPSGRPCDTEIDFWAQTLNTCGLPTEVVYIDNDGLAPEIDRKSIIWKSYHSPDQVLKNEPFLKFWKRIKTFSQTQFIDSIHELILSNKFILSKIDQNQLRLKTECLLSQDRDPNSWLGENAVFKLGNSAASRGVIRGRNLTPENMASFKKQFLHPHTIIQKDLTELIQFPYLGWVGDELAFGYGPLIVSPLIVESKIIGFANHVLTPFGRWNVPTFSQN